MRALDYGSLTRSLPKSRISAAFDLFGQRLIFETKSCKAALL